MADLSSLKLNAPVNRLRGSLPKVGIRPTIDGRYGGVRESLEGFTMALAESARDLIQKNLRHSCGLPIEVVIADTCIGGASEAAKCEEKFAREGVGVSLTVTPCWCYGSETMDMNLQRPKAIWGFNGTDRPGAVYLAATLSGHAQKGLPCFGIYGRDVQDLGDASIPTDVAEKILRFAKAGLAVATMRGKSYMAMGGVSMGIAGSIVDHNFFESYLGMRVETIDMSEFAGRIRKGIFDQEEYTKALAWVKANCKEGKDWNPTPRTREQKDEDWETSVKMTLIAKDLMIGNPKLAEMGFKEQSEGHDAIAGGFQGQRQWTDHFPNGDFLEAIMCTSFDWNGIRQPYMVATENDSLNGASMLLGHLLTGTAQMFSDVRTYWSAKAIQRVTGKAENPVLHLINSGPSPLDFTASMKDANGKPTIKPWWDITPEDAGACLGDTQWCASDLGYFPSGGWSTDFTTKGRIPITMFRINLVKGLGPALQIAEGHAVNLPGDVHQALDERTSPTWPTTWFEPRCDGGDGAFKDAYTVMAYWGANHGAISVGHIGADLITLASMLRVPVDMHNVPFDQIYRPAVWNRFGSGMDSVGADYRACSNYGPLYG